MKFLKINFQQDQVELDQYGKIVYKVQKPEGQPTGFFNAFNVFIKEKQADQVEEMFEIESTIYAYPDARYKSGYRFEQY